MKLRVFFQVNAELPVNSKNYPEACKNARLSVSANCMFVFCHVMCECMRRHWSPLGAANYECSHVEYGAGQSRPVRFRHSQGPGDSVATALPVLSPVRVDTLSFAVVVVGRGTGLSAACTCRYVERA